VNEPKKRRALPVVELTPPRIEEAVRVASAELLARRSRMDLEASSADAFVWLEELSPRVEAKIPRSAPVDCSAGCAYCCHLKVTASPVEVLALADHLRRTLSPERLRALKRKLDETDRRTHGQTTDQRASARVPCPLLDEAGLCAGYEARPLKCRGANSSDRGACERAFTEPERDLGIPLYVPQMALADALSTGLATGAFTAGLDGSLVELVAGLRAALEHPDATSRWLRGEPVLQKAIDPETHGRG
jgi:Fe-S-cluster containining protein